MSIGIVGEIEWSSHRRLVARGWVRPFPNHAVCEPVPEWSVSCFVFSLYPSELDCCVAQLSHSYPRVPPRTHPRHRLALHQTLYLHVLSVQLTYLIVLVGDTVALLAGCYYQHIPLFVTSAHCHQSQMPFTVRGQLDCCAIPGVSNVWVDLIQLNNAASSQNLSRGYAELDHQSCSRIWCFDECRHLC